jgi:hypothetical protein
MFQKRLTDDVDSVPFVYFQPPPLLPSRLDHMRRPCVELTLDRQGVLTWSTFPPPPPRGDAAGVETGGSGEVRMGTALAVVANAAALTIEITVVDGPKLSCVRVVHWVPPSSVRSFMRCIVFTIDAVYFL